MLYKAREKPQLLHLLELLDRRMQLDKETDQVYYNMKKSYEGERKFDQLKNQLTCECLILNDLLFEMNHTTFQIDTLIIMQNSIYVYELKHFYRDYCYEGDKLFKMPQLEVVNPIFQLSRAELLLRQMLLKQNINVMIDGSVIFIHPEFMLYQASANQPIILNAQLKLYLHTLNQTPSQLTTFHYQIAEKLVQLHQTYSRHAKQPTY